MGICIMFIVACALFYLLRLISIKKRKRDKGEQFIRWGLGVDCCHFYSKPFIVTDQCITIIGFQEVVDNKSPICYSLVKMNWWGKRTVYSHCLIYESYKGTQGFQINMENIPNGEDYKIEVFNGCIMSFGRFQVR